SDALSGRALQPTALAYVSDRSARQEIQKRKCYRRECKRSEESSHDLESAQRRFSVTRPPECQTWNRGATGAFTAAAWFGVFLYVPQNLMAPKRRKRRKTPNIRHRSSLGYAHRHSFCASCAFSRPIHSGTFAERPYSATGAGSGR